MMKIGLLAMIAVAFIAQDAVAQRGTLGREDSKPVRRTYRNPLLPETNLADPHVLRFNGVYYLYATTHTKGYDVYTSDNLVDWVLRGSVYSDPRGGIWAPDVFFDSKGAGKFYLYYTSDMPGRPPGGRNKVIGVAMSNSPLGPFVDQGVLCEIAIDAHLFQDDDKKLYLYYVDLTDGFKIMVQSMSDPLTKEGEPQEVIRPTDSWEKMAGEVTEGPFVLKHRGTYYLMYSGSGANSPDYAIGYATSDSPLGPFTKHPGNPIVKRGNKVLGPGHHCVVEGPDNKLWMVYHQKWTEERSFRRFLAVDPIAFDHEGVIVASVSRDTLEPAPLFRPRLASPKSR